MEMWKGSHFGSRTRGPQLKRSHASKDISYDSAGSMSRGRTPQQPREDEPENYELSEFSIHGKGDVEEMSNVFRFLGLPAPGNIGITRESWDEVVKQSPTGSPLDGVRNYSGRMENIRSLSLPSESDLTHPKFANESTGTTPEDDTESSAGGGFKSASAQSSPLRSPFSKCTSASAIPDPGRPKVSKKDRAGNVSQQPATVDQQTVASAQGDLSKATADLDRKEEQNSGQPQAILSEDPRLADARHPTAPSQVDESKATADLNRKDEPNLAQPQTIQPLDPGLAEAGQSTAPAGNPVDETQAASTSRRRDFMKKFSKGGGSQTGSLVLKAPPPMRVAKFSQPQNTMALMESLAPDSKELKELTGLSDDEDNDTRSGSGEETSEQASEAVHRLPDGEPEQHLQSGEQMRNAGGTEETAAGAAADSEGVQVDEDKRVLRLPSKKTETIELDHVGQKVPLEQPVINPEPLHERPVGPNFPWVKGQQLGAGSFGTVFEAVDRDGLFFAVKEVPTTESDKKAQDAIAQLMQEIELLSSFRHPNIVQYMGTQKADGKLYIFLELVARGSLADICRRLPLTDSQISAYTRQILKGLKYLHDRRVVHRDIKCANILVDTLGVCKLADFGMAKQISNLDQMKSAKGSAYWMAPEVINPKQSSSFPADIWSLGCSVLEMALRAPPFGDVEWYRVMWIVGHGTAPDVPKTLPETAQDFISRCLEINPTRRPTATQLLEHPFVKQGLTPTNSGGLTPTSSGPVYYTPPAQDMSTITEERSGEYSSGSGPGTQVNKPHANGDLSS